MSGKRRTIDTADDLVAIIGGIDPSAVMPDRYWPTFIDDVWIRDLSTEAVSKVSELTLVWLIVEPTPSNVDRKVRFDSLLRSLIK
jgi:hypothetical protein